MRLTELLLLVTLFVPFQFSNAQQSGKRALTTKDFSSWKSIENQTISNDGQWTSFEINPQKGDGNLIVKSITTDKTDTIHRGFEARCLPRIRFYRL